MAERDELRIPQFRGDLAKWAGRPKARLPCCGDDGGHSRLPFRRFARSRELATKGPSRARVRSAARMESGEASARPRAPKPRRSARSVLFGQSLAGVPGSGGARAERRRNRPQFCLALAKLASSRARTWQVAALYPSASPTLVPRQPGLHNVGTGKLRLLPTPRKIPSNWGSSKPRPSPSRSTVSASTADPSRHGPFQLASGQPSTRHLSVQRHASRRDAAPGAANPTPLRCGVLRRRGAANSERG
jgi:hypothetical protein